jgi:hypothetical protein
MEDLKWAHADCIEGLESTAHYVQDTTVHSKDVERLDLQFKNLRERKDDDCKTLLQRIERKRKEIESLSNEVRNRTFHIVSRLES